MISFKSSYYDKEIVLDEEMQDVLYDGYMNIASNHNFTPEISNADEICSGDIFDHVAYHVELHKDEVSDFDVIEDLFA